MKFHDLLQRHIDASKKLADEARAILGETNEANLSERDKALLMLGSAFGISATIADIGSFVVAAIDTKQEQEETDFPEISPQSATKH